MIENFISLLEIKLILAGFGTVIIFSLMVVLLFIIVTAYQQRKTSLRVNLPNLDESGNLESIEPQFKQVEDLSIELIDAKEDVIKENNHENNDKLFFTALTLESKAVICEGDVDMPNADEYTSEIIKVEKENFIQKQTKKTLEKIKKVAEADQKEMAFEATKNDNKN